MSFKDEEIPFFNDSVPVRSEPQSFAPEQMIRCDACLRANPPTRTSCLYCAEQLPVTETSRALQTPTLRRLEKWEQGFNVILLPENSITAQSTETIEEIARFLRLGVEDAKRIIEAHEPLPLARAAGHDEATLIERKLGELSINSLVVADVELGIEEAGIRRVRALELSESALIAYPAGGGDATRLSWSDIVLLVTGRLFRREIEVEERRGRQAENEIVDAREMSADEALLDIYTAEGTGSLRIRSGSFDFSCLGPAKNLVTIQNFSTLVDTLQARAPLAMQDNSYNRVRHQLAVAWPLEQQTESRGWNRKRPGQISTESVTRSDNELQFTRYSRLRRYLQQHPPESKA